MRYRLIDAEKAEHRISRLCKLLGVTRQGFYAWRRRGPSLRQLGDAELARLIVTIYDGSLQTYGACGCRQLDFSGVALGAGNVG
jgi:putative transposase